MSALVPLSRFTHSEYSAFKPFQAGSIDLAERVNPRKRALESEQSLLAADALLGLSRALEKDTFAQKPKVSKHVPETVPQAKFLQECLVQFQRQGKTKEQFVIALFQPAHAPLSIPDKALIYSLLKRNLSLSFQALRQGANPRLTTPLVNAKTVGLQGQSSILQWAIASGNVPLEELLIKYGA